MRVDLFEPGRDLAAVLAMCAAEGWPGWSDPGRVRRALGAAGCLALVALDGEETVGFAQILTDGVLTSYLALLVTAATHRRRGVARALADEAFARTGVGRMDLLADEDAHGFYRSMAHRRLPGFRVFDGYRGGHLEA
ncbi:GNAT family N-acetyltransferase [Phytomonospora endophytica]|uniref:Ribosomal protein S18 acetylase RimI-like enzyme n=1 Tax=Phytomonospora endophytica TaxID=714109 RepID=A0A841FQI6_9ACTN|nr:GNAT family N-acetyltransferase [Phytomonospora endophytica]MBB6034220.1 ribosomal protein S18 acetylase RimI-like enzyme [Phytomonospora endophytica]GIG66613.1 hypothetical protein Pen01_29080 [Phytomonospora endophytica]